MHHSNEPSNFDTIEKLKQLYPIGATGRFPEGQLHKSDEGEIAFAVGVERGKIVIEFGKSVAWVGMNPEQADSLADLLKARARSARNQAIGNP
jgi:hypothetical protein